MMDKIKILIVGAGAVGSYYGGRLAQNTETSVAVVCRSDYETVKQNGFDIKSIEGDFIFRPDGVFRSCAEYSDSPDYIIIATKVLPEIDIVNNIRPAVKANTSIVLIQNGIDIEKDIAAAFPDNALISGIAYIGVGRDGAGRVNHQGGGRLRLGLYPEGHSGKLDTLVELFKKIRVNCEKVDDIVLVRWEKLVWNAPFNPVSVLAGCVNTKVMVENPLLETLCRNIMLEVCKVAAACGKKLPDDIIEKNIGYTRDFPPYKTSMLLDYENKRPLEVDAILGNVARLAKQQNVSVPHIDTIHALLNSINSHG